VRLPPRKFYFVCGRRADRLIRYRVDQHKAIGEYRMGDMEGYLRWIIR
jgi:hypothetical protein